MLCAQLGRRISGSCVVSVLVAFFYLLESASRRIQHHAPHHGSVRSGDRLPGGLQPAPRVLTLFAPTAYRLHVIHSSLEPGIATCARHGRVAPSLAITSQRSAARGRRALREGVRSRRPSGRIFPRCEADGSRRDAREQLRIAGDSRADGISRFQPLLLGSHDEIRMHVHGTSG